MSSILVEVVALALQRVVDGKYLLARRGPEQSGAGCWEFPGGKVEHGETHPQALCREIKEELGLELDLQKLEYIASNLHQYPSKQIRLHLWKSYVDQPVQFELLDHDQITWCHPNEMKTLLLSEADIPFIDKLL